MTGGHCKVVEHKVQELSRSIHFEEQLQHRRPQWVALEAKDSQLEEFAQLVWERSQVVVVQHQLTQTVKYYFAFNI